MDSGSFQSAVQPHIVPRELWNETTSNISCVHGDEKEYPTAEIYLTVGGQTYLMSVALVPSLPYPVVLGNDVPTFLDLIQARSEHQITRERHVKSTSEAPEQQEQRPQPAVTVCNMVVTRAQKARNTLEELPFYHDQLEAVPVK